MSEYLVGVLGASSLVGESLMSRLLIDRQHIAAFSREDIQRIDPGVTWYKIEGVPFEITIQDWVCLAPIWILPDYFSLFERCGARRIVALSSTSRFTKADSSDSHEKTMAIRLAEAEEQFARWAKTQGVDWCVLRPTLIYGFGRDHNISEIIHVIRRYRFFPLLGKSKGLRQPVHAEDVAQACKAALEYPDAIGRSYNLSGGETLPYRKMIERVFLALEKKPRFIYLPLSFFKMAILLLRQIPRYRHWSGAMAERMNRDLVFDHSEAKRDLGFEPRGFELGHEDLPDE